MHGMALLCLAALAQGYVTDFDGGAPDWTIDVLPGARWAADATPAAFPHGISRSGLSLNFNNGTDYAGGARGGAVSPPVDLSLLTNPVVEFWCNYETETRGTAFDRRFLQVWDGSASARNVEWRLASVGYSFDPVGGIAGAGPGPCAEAYDDLETGAPVSTWHFHRVPLDPAWGTVRLRFVFSSVDDLRNGYAGWAVDDLEVKSHSTPPPAGWPDLFQDTDTQDGDGNELDICETRPGGRMSWSLGTTNIGSPGVHLVIGDHPESILDRTFMFYDPVHAHWHLSQFTDVSLWSAEPFGFRKIRRGPKRSFCLADVEPVLIGPPSVTPVPRCASPYEVISYGWQDVYPIDTPGQDMDVSGLPSGSDYWLIAVLDPINRMRETIETNQTDQIHFVMPSAAPAQVTILGRNNPYPPSVAPLTIATAVSGTFQGAAAIHVTGTGLDTSLSPVVYDAGTAVKEAPFYVIVTPEEIWVEIPAGITSPASIDLLRADGKAASLRMGGATGTPTSPPPLPSPDDDDDCGATGMEIFLVAALTAGRRLRRRSSS